MVEIENRGLSSDEKIQNALKEKSIIIKSEEDEVRQIINRFNQRKNSYEKFVLEITPTLQCNFRCNYCFQKRNDFIMDEKIQELIRNLFMIKLGKCKEMSVSWFGGEPLLATEVIDNLSKFFINQCERNHVNYHAELISNGYFLTPELIDKCKEWKISKIQVTLDGSPQTIAKIKNISLDESRLYISRLISLIPYIISKQITIKIRMNIDYNNTNEIFFTPYLLNELSIIHPNIIFQLKSIKIPLPDNKYMMECSIPTKEFIDIDIKFKQYINSLGFTIHNNYLNHLHYCGATDINTFGIDPHGYIYKCSVFIGDKNKAILHITDLIEELKHKQGKSITHDENPDFTDCYSCTFFPLCYGGCLMKRNITECHVMWKYRLKDRLELLKTEVMTLSK